MNPVIDLAGKRFGRLTVIGIGERLGRKLRWRCVCSCGKFSMVIGDNLKGGNTRSCGCLDREAQARRSDERAKRVAENAKRVAKYWHGHTRKEGWVSPTYSTWRAMRHRCLNKNTKAYKDYGGRGITICERWLMFANFLADMGERPEGRTIDRINPYGDYEPGNCRWATPLEQRHNQRKDWDRAEAAQVAV